MEFPAFEQFLRVIPAPELRPRTVNFHTIRDLGEGYFQPDGQPRFVGKRAVMRFDVGATAQRNNGALHGRHSLQVLMLNISEMRLAALFEDFRDTAMFTPFDFFVQIDERPTEFLRQHAADGRLAGAHETDEVNAAVLHFLLAAPCRACIRSAHPAILTKCHVVTSAEWVL